MAHNPKLSVYIVTLKPRKKDEQKTFRDFLREKYAGDSMTSDGELLQRLFEDFINKVGQDKFNKDDKSKKDSLFHLRYPHSIGSLMVLSKGESMDFCASLRILRIKQRSR